MSQFIRAYRLTVGTVEIDARDGVGPNALRIAFNVERDHRRYANNAEAAIWNLSRGQREALAKLDVVPVRIEAGYADDVGVIFQGDLRSARSRREGPDIITRVSAGDGESNIRTAKVSRTFARGTPVGDVLGQLGAALGVSPGNLSQFRGAQLANGSRTLTRALTINGAASDELERWCRSCGLEWSVQSGALQLREAGRPVGSETGPLLRADSGLIGDTESETEVQIIPVYAATFGPPTATGSVAGNARGPQVGTKRLTKTKVNGVCLMRADLVPGRSFRVESSVGGHTGNLVCVKTVHEGDSHSDSPWYVSWSGTPY